MTYRDAMRKIRAEIDKAIRARVSVSELDRNVAAILEEWSPKQKIRERILEAAREEFGFVTPRVMSDIERRLYATAVETAGSQYALTKNGLRDDVRSVVASALSNDLSTSDMENAIANVLSRRRSYFRTIARTAVSALDTAARVGQAEEAGAVRYRYVGAPAERDFCREHLGKEYTLDEIRKMDNGQGLDVLLYRGGWNCRHQWIPVFDKSTPKSKIPAAPAPAPVAAASKAADQIVDDPLDNSRDGILKRVHPSAKQAWEKVERDRGQEIDVSLWKNLGDDFAIESVNLRKQNAYVMPKNNGSGAEEWSVGSSKSDRAKFAKSYATKVVYHEAGHVLHMGHRNKSLRFHDITKNLPLGSAPKQLLDDIKTRVFANDHKKQQEIYERNVGKLGNIEKEKRLLREKVKLKNELFAETDLRKQLEKEHGVGVFDFLDPLTGCIEDTLSALTDGFHGHGHGYKNYFDTDSAQLAELVAHAAEYRFAKLGKTTFRAVIDEHFPEVADVLEEVAKTYFD